MPSVQMAMACSSLAFSAVGETVRAVEVLVAVVCCAGRRRCSGSDPPPPGEQQTGKRKS